MMVLDFADVIFVQGNSVGASKKNTSSSPALSITLHINDQPSTPNFSQNEKNRWWFQLSTQLKNMIVKMGSSSLIFGVKITKSL